MNTTTAAPASAFFRGWRDLEALLATKGWGVRASPAVGDGADVLYFVPPPPLPLDAWQVILHGKPVNVAPWALRGSAGSMMPLDPDTASQVEARPPQWRLEGMLPGALEFPTRNSFTLACGDVLVGLGFMAPQQFADGHPDRPTTAVGDLQARVDAAAALDPAFTVHDAGYSPDDFATTADMVAAAALMDLLDGDGVSDEELQAAMAMPHDAPGRDEAMTRVFGDDRRNWPGDVADIDGPVHAALQGLNLTVDAFDHPTTAAYAAEAVGGMTDGEAATFATVLHGQVGITREHVSTAAGASFRSLWEGIPGVTYHGGVALDPNVAPVDMVVVEGNLPRAATRPGLTREQFAAALLASKRRTPAWRRLGPALGRAAAALFRQMMGAR